LKGFPGVNIESENWLWNFRAYSNSAVQLEAKRAFEKKGHMPKGFWIGWKNENSLPPPKDNATKKEKTGFQKKSRLKGGEVVVAGGRGG